MRHCGNEPIEAFLPVDPPEAQNKRTQQSPEQRFCRISWVCRLLWRIDSIRDDRNALCRQAELAQFLSLGLGGHMNCRGPCNIAALEEADPRRLQPPALTMDEIAYQHATGCKDIGHTG